MKTAAAALGTLAGAFLSLTLILLAWEPTTWSFIPANLPSLAVVLAITAARLALVTLALFAAARLCIRLGAKTHAKP